MVKLTNVCRYPGHSAHVTCTRFTYNDKRVISTGGNDKTILQWRKVDESQKILPHDEDLDDPIVVKELENTNYEKNRSMKEKVKLVAVKNEPMESIETRFEKAARPPPKGEAKGIIGVTLTYVMINISYPNDERTLIWF